MAEKNLTEAGWKAFAKGKSYKDAAFIKALGAVDKAGPAALTEALADVEKQSELLLKAHKGDKELAAYMDGVDKAVAKERKTAEQAAEGDEAESPALLTTKMVPLLRQVRNGDPMQALIATAGKDTAVLMSRKSISPSRRKLLTEQLGTASGVKFIVAECLFENEAHTFVVQAQAAGLAKKLKAALLVQTGMRVKVRVRGLDPNDVDEAAEEDGEAAATADPAGTGGAAGTADAQAAARPADAQLAAAYQAKLAQLQPRIDAAAQSADAPKRKALLDFAAGKAADGNHAAAAQALLTLEKLLPSGLAAAPSAAPAAKGVDAGAAFNARLAALMPKVKAALAAGGATAQSLRDKVAQAGAMARDKNFAAAQVLLDESEALLGAGDSASTFDEEDFRRRWASASAQWNDAIETVDGQLARLQSALRALDDPDLTDIADNGLLGVTGNHKARMIAAVLDVQNARGPALVKAATRALKIAGQFRNHLATEQTVRVTDENAFGVPVTMRSSLGGALSQIETTLRTAAA